MAQASLLISLYAASGVFVSQQAIELPSMDQCLALQEQVQSEILKNGGERYGPFLLKDPSVPKTPYTAAECIEKGGIQVGPGPESNALAVVAANGAGTGAGATPTGADKDGSAGKAATGNAATGNAATANAAPEAAGARPEPTAATSSPSILPPLEVVSVDDPDLGRRVFDAIPLRNAEFNLNRFEDARIGLGLVDLTGDGKDEIVVQHYSNGLCGSAGCPFYILEERDGDLVRLADFFARGFSVLRTVQNGYRDLLSSGWKAETVWRFIDGAYQPAGTIPQENASLYLPIEDLYALRRWRDRLPGDSVPEAASLMDYPPLHQTMTTMLGESWAGDLAAVMGESDQPARIIDEVLVAPVCAGPDCGRLNASLTVDLVLGTVMLCSNDTSKGFVSWVGSVAPEGYSYDVQDPRHCDKAPDSLATLQKVLRSDQAVMPAFAAGFDGVGWFRDGIKGRVVVNGTEKSVPGTPLAEAQGEPQTAEPAPPAAPQTAAVAAGDAPQAEAAMATGEPAKLAPSAEILVPKTRSNVRSGPGTGHAKLGVADAGQKLIVQDRADGGAWTVVDWDGNPGYIASRLLVTEKEYAAIRAEASRKREAAASGSKDCGKKHAPSGSFLGDVTNAFNSVKDCF